MQNDRDDRYRNYDNDSRNRDNQKNDIIGYSAIPGPSFDAGRYGTDQNRSYDHDRNSDKGIINRHFDNSTLGSNNYSAYSGDRSDTAASRSGGYSYDRSRDFGDYSRQNYTDNSGDRSQNYANDRRMGGIGSYGEPADRMRNNNYGGSEQAASLPVRNAYERYHGYAKTDRSNDWMRDMDPNRDYRRSSINTSSYGRSSYTGPNYGSIQTGGRFDNDREFTSSRDRGFTSGGISSMGGDYDRERTRGRQYRDNYDSAGSYIGDHKQREENKFSNEGRNSYNSSFTFGGGSSGREPGSRSQSYGNQDYDRHEARSNESHWGGRYAGDQDWQRNHGSHYGGSGYNPQWRERSERYQGNRHSHNPSDPSQYHSYNTHTGNPDYDRGNFRAADYVHNRPGHEDEDRGFFEKAGERVRSWFGGHEDDRNRY